MRLDLDRQGAAAADSTAKITSDGLLGGAHVVIEPGGSTDNLKAGARSRTPRARSTSFGLVGQMLRPQSAGARPARRANAARRPAARRQRPHGRLGRLVVGFPSPCSRSGRSADLLDMLRTAGARRPVRGARRRGAVSPPWFFAPVRAASCGIGYFSLPVVGLTAVFTGAALALNIYTGGGRFNAEQIMPQIVALGITRELGPVLAALMLAGRVSAAIAAEIGAMRATEQIDALQTLSTDPFRYLVAPRLLAAVIVPAAADRWSPTSSASPAAGWWRRPDAGLQRRGLRPQHLGLPAAAGTWSRA